MKLSQVLGIVFSLCIFGVLSGVTWSEPEKVLAVGSAPTICIDNNGIAWVVASTWLSEVARFTDEQTGWQKVTECYFGHHGDGMPKPAVCFDKDDIIWVLVSNGSGSYYRCYDGETWTEIDTVPTNIYWSEGPRITADSSDGVWVGWTTEWGYYYWDVGCNRYKDGTWGEPKPVTDTLGVDENELWSMTTDANGRVWFGWKNYYFPEDSNETPLVTKYYDGDSWGDEYTIWTEEGVWGYCLDLAPDREGGMWALWNSAKGTFFVLASHWDGEAWSEQDTLADAGLLGGDAPLPMGKLAVDTYGNVWAVWRQALEVSDTYGDIYYSVNSGSGWSKPAPVNENPVLDWFPDLAVDSEGRVWCVWWSVRDDSGGVWASYTTSAGVEEEGFIQPPKSRIESIYPNPFKSLTTISYSVAGRLGSKESQYVELSIFDVTGRQVKALVSDKQSPARYEIIWNGKDDKGLRCASGVYFVRMRSDEFEANGRLILLR